LVVDDAGRPIPFGPLACLRETLRLGWFLVLDSCLRGLAALLARRPPAPDHGEQRDRRRPVVLVLPVLPDLSHTFVYREVLAILRQQPTWRIVVLARNAQAPVHAEADRLAAVSTYLRRDGITRHALRVLAWLLRRRGRELFGLYRAAAGGSVRDLLGKNALRDSRHPGNAFALADQLAPWAPRELHVYSSTYPANVAMGAAHLLGVPLSISSYVDFEFPYAHKMLAEKLARARFFRVVTSYCQHRLRGLPGLPALPLERVPIVYLGLDLEHWQDEAPLAGRGRLVSAARIVPKKGLHLVPEALALLRRNGVQCSWRVIGDGPELESLRAACRRAGLGTSVEFLGPKDNATVRAELLAADAALLPCVVAADGERDGIPIFLVEAMALGVPVITTPVSGIPELVRDADTGFLAAPGDSRALADAIKKALGDPPLARTIGQRGRAAVRRQLDVTESARLLIEHIER
jgi:glycosyltransferase involved in cell wall biosynthesis